MKSKKIKEDIPFEEEIPKKYRCFEFVVYDESKHYKIDDIFFSLHGFKYWAWIKHQPEQKEKQEHYHILIKLDNATTIESISKKTGVPTHKIQYVKNIRAMCRYLIHLDDPEKIQYSYNDVHVSKLFERKFKKNFEELKTEEEIIQDIYFFIDNSHFDNYHEKLKYLLLFVNFNCYDTIYKRYRLEFLDYMKSNL